MHIVKITGRNFFLTLLFSTQIFLVGCDNDPLGIENPPRVDRDLEAYVHETFDRTNVERSLAARHALLPSPRLIDAAQIQADQMAEFQVADHVIPGAEYPTIEDRLKVVQYRYAWAGEILTEGLRTPAQVIEAWLNSPEHREIFLSRRADEMGLGIARDSEGRHYYVMVVAERL